MFSNMMAIIAALGSFCFLPLFFGFTLLLLFIAYCILLGWLNVFPIFKWHFTFMCKVWYFGLGIVMNGKIWITTSIGFLLVLISVILMSIFS